MSISRRHFAHLVWGSVGAAGLVAAVPALARPSGPSDLPNVFFSPHGKPFRAKPGAPYPVADWFAKADKNGDGKIDHAEFMADAEAFFTELDLNADGQLDPYEISMYEHRVAPEILGYRVNLASAGQRMPGHDGAVLWRAQYSGMPGQQGQSQGPFGSGGPGSPHVGPDEGIDPAGGQPNEPTRPKNDIGTGAAPYSLLDEAEPVTAADVDFLFRGSVRKGRYMSRADEHFSALGGGETGFLTLASLPMTPIQKLIASGSHADLELHILH